MGGRVEARVSRVDSASNMFPQFSSTHSAQETATKPTTVDNEGSLRCFVVGFPFKKNNRLFTRCYKFFGKPHYLQGFVHPRWFFGISEPSTASCLFHRSKTHLPACPSATATKPVNDMEILIGSPESSCHNGVF